MAEENKEARVIDTADEDVGTVDPETEGASLESPLAFARGNPLSPGGGNSSSSRQVSTGEVASPGALGSPSYEGQAFASSTRNIAERDAQQFEGSEDGDAHLDAHAGLGAQAEFELEPSVVESIVVELTDDEKMILCIEWVEKRIDLPRRAPLDAESRAVVAKFFADASNKDVALYAYKDKESERICVRNVPPLVNTGETHLVQYFFKDSEYNFEGIPHVQSLQQSIFFGYIRTGNAMEDLTSMVRQLCLPQLRSNHTWPASVSKELVSSLERYMANLTDLANVAAGKTVLYVPNDDLSQSHVCAEDKVCPISLQDSSPTMTLSTQGTSASMHASMHANTDACATWSMRRV